MASINLQTMQEYLSLSISSFNRNKLNGLLAEIDLRNTLSNLNYLERISQGGWIVRNVGNEVFSHHTYVLFPATIYPGIDYSPDNNQENPPLGLHTICSTMHQIGVHSFYCLPTISSDDDYNSINWISKQLGIPNPTNYQDLYSLIQPFTIRSRNYNFLRNNADITNIPVESIPVEFVKEHLRVTFQNRFMCEISDIDGIFWGQQYTYPLEIKEKTVAFDSKVGNYFGIDVGPFVKLAFYAAKKGNLHSLFFVREIDDPENRNLLNWWFITFDTLAQFASWVPMGGGRNMLGGTSTVIKIPRSEFTILNRETIALL